MDVVSVRVPAMPRYLHVIRLVAAGLAARLRFTIEDIDDLKIAVSELFAYMTGSQGRDGTLDIRFEVLDDRIEIHGVGNLEPGQKVRGELTDLSKMILATTADESSLDLLDGLPRFRLTKARR